MCLRFIFLYPLINIVRYFGGSLDIFALEGWGSDVFLKLRCLDEAGDAAI